VYRPDPADERTYRLLHRLVEGAFAAHWDHTARPYPQWRERFDASPGLDPDQWWLADVDGQAGAVLIGDESRADVGRGWVRTLGVVPAARGRGAAKTLLRTAFAHAASRGRTAVGLSVDSENASGATALYESVGMRTQTVLLAWKGEVPGQAARAGPGRPGAGIA
jgi:mycothiol synthase